ALTPERVLAGGPFATGGRSGEPAAGAAPDPPQPLDVDMDQLTRPLTLIALSWLKPETSELAHSDPRQDSRHGRQRHVEDPGELRTGEPQPAQGRDRLDPLLTGPVRDPMRRRGAVPQPALPLGAVADHPFAGARAQPQPDRAHDGLSD